MRKNMNYIPGNRVSVIFLHGDGRGCLHRPPLTYSLSPSYLSPGQGGVPRQGGGCSTTTNHAASAPLERKIMTRTPGNRSTCAEVCQVVYYKCIRTPPDKHPAISILS